MFIIPKGQSRSLEDLKTIDLNTGDAITDRYHPIKHSDFVATIHKMATDMGLEIANSEWMVKNSDKILYGRVDFYPGSIPDIADRGDIYLSLGARQSTDGRYAMVFFSGAIDIARQTNYMFKEIEYRRRHTANASDEDVVENALYEFIEDCKQISTRIDRLKKIQASHQDMAYVIMRMAELRAIPKKSIMQIWNHWKTLTSADKRNFNGYELYLSAMHGTISSLPHKQLTVMRDLESILRETL